MTAVDEALARDEAAVALARETIAILSHRLLSEFADQIEAAAERADYAIAGRTIAPLPVAHKLIDACLAIAAAARGKAEVTR